MIAACREIAASFPSPRFYASCEEDLRFSRVLFEENPLIEHCRKYIQKNLQDDFGHGVEHAERVSVEAGAIAHREGGRFFLGTAFREEVTLLAQIAGLLHDLRRKEKNHAQASALAAVTFLREFSLGREKEGYLRTAISNHEAFTEPQPIDCAMGQIISDALYDADKFRWGPDNFTVTLWRMLRFAQAPIPRLVSRFPKGMKGISRIKDTFRTETGRRYGPEFIDLGLQMGEEIYRFLKAQFAEEMTLEETRSQN